MNKFYVYAYLREDIYSPFYIGKGCGKRCYYKSGKNCKPPKDRSRIIIIKDNLLENDAFYLEEVLINFWGRNQQENRVQQTACTFRTALNRPEVRRPVVFHRTTLRVKQSTTLHSTKFQAAPMKHRRVFKYVSLH